MVAGDRFKFYQPARASCEWQRGTVIRFYFPHSALVCSLWFFILQRIPICYPMSESGRLQEAKRGARAFWRLVLRLLLVSRRGVPANTWRGARTEGGYVA